MEHSEQPCPLCDAVASAEVDPHGDPTDFLCAKCGRFRITRVALKRLLDAPIWKDRMREAIATCPDTHRVQLQRVPGGIDLEIVLVKPEG